MSSKNSEVSVENLANAIFDFSIEIFQELFAVVKGDNSNLVISPCSIWTALAITYLGSTGKSSEDLGKVLHLLHLKKEELPEAIHKFRKALIGSNDSMVAVANKLAVSKECQLKQSVTESKILEVEACDFSKNPEVERVKLNKWVEEKTRGKIPELLALGNIDESTILVILNAIFFKGNWLRKFNVSYTAKGNFTCRDGEVKEVDMMFQKGRFNYVMEPSLKLEAIEIPYSDENFSTIMILPDENQNIDECIQNLNHNQVQKLLTEMSFEELNLYMPKFNAKSSYELEKVLQILGAGAIYQSIDMSEFLRSSSGMKVSAVIHQACLEVNEQGAEAAAATAVRICLCMSSVMLEMTFNRPFLLYIYNKSLNTILFMCAINFL